MEASFGVIFTHGVYQNFLNQIQAFNTASANPTNPSIDTLNIVFQNNADLGVAAHKATGEFLHGLEERM